MNLQDALKHVSLDWMKKRVYGNRKGNVSRPGENPNVIRKKLESDLFNSVQRGKKS